MSLFSAGTYVYADPDYPYMPLYPDKKIASSGNDISPIKPVKPLEVSYSANELLELEELEELDLEELPF